MYRDRKKSVIVVFNGMETWALPHPLLDEKTLKEIDSMNINLINAYRMRSDNLTMIMPEFEEQFLADISESEKQPVVVYCKSVVESLKKNNIPYIILSPCIESSSDKYFWIGKLYEALKYNSCLTVHNMGIVDMFIGEYEYYENHYHTPYTGNTHSFHVTESFEGVMKLVSKYEILDWEGK